MKRYRDNAACVHAWAGRHSDDGETPSESIFFTGLTIYSYGYHFPMARHISFNDVLLTYATYSNTTSKHQSDVWRSVSHKNTIYVHDVLDPLSKNGVEATIASATQLLKDASKRRSKERANDDIHSAWQQVENLYEIAEFDKDFKADWKRLPGEWKRKLGALRKLIAECKLDASTALANMGVKELAAQKRAKAAAQKKLKAMVAQAEGILEQWLNGERDNSGMHQTQQLLGTDGLRLAPTGLTVSTTQGLVVPAEDCRRAWPLIQRVYRGEGEVALTEAQSQRFGNFQLSRIEKDGTVVVGCHRFKRWMVERLANQLGLTS